MVRLRSATGASDLARALLSRRRDPVDAVLLVGVPVVAILFVLTATNHLDHVVLWENAHWTAAAAAAFVAALVGVATADDRTREVRRAFAVAMGSYLVGQVAWDIQVARGLIAVPAPSDIFFLMTGVVAAVGLVRAVRGRMSLTEEVTVHVDAAIVSFAITTAVVGGLGGVSAGSGAAGIVLLLYPILFLAPAGAGLVVALATRAPIGLRGVYGVLGGFVLMAVAWVVWIAESLVQVPPPGSPVNYVFSIAILVIGFAGATWTAQTNDTPLYRATTRALRAGVTIAAVALAVGTLIYWSEANATAPAGIAPAAAAVIALTLLRQWLLARENAQVLSRERDAAERERRAREEALEALQAQQDSERRYRSVVEIYNRLAERISFALGDDELISAARNALARLVPNERGNALLLNASQHHLLVTASWGPDGLKPGSVAPLDRPVRCPGVRRGSPYQVTDASDDLAPGCPAMAASSGSTLCVPMLALGEVVGVIHLARPDVDGFDVDMQYQASRVAEQTALAIANSRLVNTMEGLAMTDPLTGLHNARFFDPFLDRELALAKREGQPLGVLMLDLDHFKRFNDTYGHPAGDVALKSFAAAVLGQLREADTVARYGGEEFVVAVRNTTLDGTLRVGEKVREAVARTVVELGPGRFGRITVSVGVANTALHGHDRLALLRIADAALYRAKQEGRNRVAAAEFVAQRDAPRVLLGQAQRIRASRRARSARATLVRGRAARNGAAPGRPGRAEAPG